MSLSCNIQNTRKRERIASLLFWMEEDSELIRKREPIRGSPLKIASYNQCTSPPLVVLYIYIYFFFCLSFFSLSLSRRIAVTSSQSTRANFPIDVLRRTNSSDSLISSDVRDRNWGPRRADPRYRWEQHEGGNSSAWQLDLRSGR